METYTYIILLVTAIIITTWRVDASIKDTYDGFKFSTALISVIFTAIFMLLGVLGDFWRTEVEVVPAISTRAGGQILVQSKFASLISDKIEHIDKPLQIRNVKGYNAWGFHNTDKFLIELAPTPENKN